jgi:hypothetical protein
MNDAVARTLIFSKYMVMLIYCIVLPNVRKSAPYSARSSYMDGNAINYKPPLKPEDLSCYLLFIRSKYSPQYPVLKHL